MKKTACCKFILHPGKVFKILFISNFILFLLSVSHAANAQAVPIQGNVTDDLGNPLNGVTAGVNGSNTATQTNVQGNYSINAPNV